VFLTDALYIYFISILLVLTAQMQHYDSDMTVSFGKYLTANTDIRFEQSTS